MRALIAAVSAAALLLTPSFLSFSSPASFVRASQVVFESASAHEGVVAPAPSTTAKKLHGRFLHVTDLHPDPHYKYHSALRGGCHHNKPKKNKPDEKDRAGWWGTALSDCDSPPRLVESSLSWAAQNLVSAQPNYDNGANVTGTEVHGIDFVIWTGDSARHDNDDKLPRTSKEIFDLNRWTLQQLEAAFPGVPLVPTFGNNDIFPHNILFPGPNAVTKEYSTLR